MAVGTTVILRLDRRISRDGGPPVEPEDDGRSRDRAAYDPYVEPMTATALIVPAIGAAFLAWTIPQMLARLFPEGVRPLFALAGLAALVMTLIAMLYFWLAYRAEDAEFAAALAERPLAAALAVTRPALLSAMLWAPILVLSVAQLPSRWTEETW